MSISKWDIMKLAESYEGEFNLADFIEEELNGLLNPVTEQMTVEELRARYFEFYDDVKDRTLEKHKWSD